MQCGKTTCSPVLWSALHKDSARGLSDADEWGGRGEVGGIRIIEKRPPRFVKYLAFGGYRCCRVSYDRFDFCLFGGLLFVHIPQNVNMKIALHVHAGFVFVTKRELRGI